MKICQYSWVAITKEVVLLTANISYYMLVNVTHERFMLVEIFVNIKHI